MLGVNQTKLDKLRTDTNKKFEQLDKVMLAVITILVVMTITLIVTVIGILRDSNQFKSEILLELIQTNQETNIKVNELINRK